MENTENGHANEHENGHGKPGRPTKRTPEIENVLIRALELFGERGPACQIAGISTEALRRWCNGDPELETRIEQAIAKVGHDALHVIAQSLATGSVKSAMWWAEHRVPGVKTTKEIQHVGAPPIDVEGALRKLSADGRNRVRAVLSEMEGSDGGSARRNGTS